MNVCIKRDAKRKSSYGKWPVTAVYNLVSKTKYGRTINTDRKSAGQVVREIVKLVE